MNTQIIESIAPNTLYTLITVPQDGVKYRFENKSPYTIFICDRSIASLDSAKSACFATVQAGQMHEFSGRFSAPFCVWTNDSIDFAYSSTIDTLVSLTTNLQGESSYTATLPIAVRSDDAGMDNVFVDAYSTASGYVYKTADLSGFFGLALTWNIADSYSLRVRIETSSDQTSWEYVTTYTGQSSYAVIPKVKRYFRVGVQAYSLTSLVTISVQVTAIRLKNPQSPQTIKVDNDQYATTILAGALPSYAFSLVAGEQNYLFTISSGSVTTLVAILNDNQTFYYLIPPSVPTLIRVYSTVATQGTIQILTTDTINRQFTITSGSDNKYDDEDLFPNTITALSSSNDLTSIPMDGYEGLLVSWATSNNFIVASVYSGDTASSCNNLVNVYAGQVRTLYLPKHDRFFRINIQGYTPSAATNISIKINVKRTRNDLPNFDNLDYSEAYTNTILSGALTNTIMPLRKGNNLIRLSVTGTTKTLFSFGGGTPRYLWLQPNVQEYITLYASQNGNINVTPLNSEAANRTLSIRNYEGSIEGQTESDVRYGIVNAYTLTNAAPTNNFSTVSSGWDWLILELSGIGLVQARELQIADNTLGLSYRMSLSPQQNAGIRRMFRVNARAGNAAFTFTAVGLTAPESIVIYAHLAKGLPTSPVL